MDVFTVLKSDHARIRDLFCELEAFAETEGERAPSKAAFVALSRELKSHSLAELEVVYPRLRAHREGQALAEMAFREHSQLTHTLDELHRVGLEDARWWPLFEDLKEQVRSHLDDEEDAIFKRLRTLTRERDWQAMGAAVLRVKETAPAA